MDWQDYALIDISFLRRGRREAGFTLMELLITVTIIGIIGAISVPALSAYYDKCCLMAAVSEITNMISEAKQKALDNDREYGVGFNPVAGKVTLIAGKGPDNKWNTADDQVVRSFSLAGGLRFGYGSYGPRSGCAAAPDGVAFPTNNALICNRELTGTAGNVYLITRRGSAMAISSNSTEYGYKLWAWSGKKWVQM